MEKRTIYKYLSRYVNLKTPAKGQELFDQFFERFQEDGPTPQNWEEDRKAQVKEDMWGHISQYSQEEKSTRIPSHRRRAYWGIAATILLLISVGGMLLWRSLLPSGQTRQPTLLAGIVYEVKPGEPIQHITLKDGSDIWLNAGTRLEILPNFGDSLREVVLEGEAFFDVKRDSLRPFLIATGPIQTRVLGTSFNISHYEGEPLSVAVATGKVMVSDQAQRQAQLVPGQRVVISAVEGWQEEPILQTRISSWREGVLWFDNETISEALPAFTRTFGYEFDITDDQTNYCRIDGAISVDRVAGLLLTLKELYQIDFQYDETEKKVSLSGGNCAP